MELVQWILIWQQQGNSIVPPTSEIRITEDSETRKTQDNEDRITEGT